jgi:site-specific recombinase XerD
MPKAPKILVEPLTVEDIKIVAIGMAAHQVLLTYKTFVRSEAMTDSFFTGWKHGPMTSNMIQKADRIARQAGIPRLHANLLRHAFDATR